MRIVESLLMVRPVEDWSEVRSPGRSRRRLRQGHAQRIVIRDVPRTDAITTGGGRTFTMHPETARECRRILDEFYEGWKQPVAVQTERAFYGGSALYVMTGN